MILNPAIQPNIMIAFAKLENRSPLHHKCRSQQFPEAHVGEAESTAMALEKEEKHSAEMLSIDGGAVKPVNWQSLSLRSSL